MSVMRRKVEFSAEIVYNSGKDEKRGLFMVKEIIKDPLFLARKSSPAEKTDLYLAKDLRDTLAAHRTECVGMAANMIGVLKRAIVFDDEGRASVMFNPEIISSSDPYETEEGCLSLSGTRKTKRFRIIKVRFRDESFQVRERVLVGWTAQIVQHEIDHCSGILI